ncbi:hypothetical protein BH23GEM11_BH23GEM11_01150 [soil metagenome]
MYMLHYGRSGSGGEVLAFGSEFVPEWSVIEPT